jgi:hypothetical protein
MRILNIVYLQTYNTNTLTILDLHHSLLLANVLKEVNCLLAVLHLFAIKVLGQLPHGPAPVTLQEDVKAVRFFIGDA